MGTDVLVDGLIDDGYRLLVKLVREGVDVQAAAWLKPADERWCLYVGLATADTGSRSRAYLTVYDCLQRLPHTSIELSDVKLATASDPIARELATIRDRYPGGRLPTRYGGNRVGGMSVDGVYIYPRVTADLTHDEVIQTVLGLMTRTDAPRPSTVTLRDGTVIRGVPFGLERRNDVGLPFFVLKIHDAADGSTRTVPADEVANLL